MYIYVVLKFIIHWIKWSFFFCLKVAYQFGQWTYAASKTSDSTVKQLNKQTGKVRLFTNISKNGRNNSNDKSDQKEGSSPQTGDPWGNGGKNGNNNNNGNNQNKNSNNEPKFEFEKQLFQVTMPANEYKIIRVEKFEFGENTMVHKQCYDAISTSLKHKYKDNPKVIETLEQFLFHGTDWTTINKIQQNGFNRDYNKRSRYGKGVYFAKYANYSHTYTSENANGERCMLLCAGIVGNSGKGNQNMSSEEQEKYDSLVDNLFNPQIFVIAKDYHCIPVCTIVYKKK